MCLNKYEVRHTEAAASSAAAENPALESRITPPDAYPNRWPKTRLPSSQHHTTQCLHQFFITSYDNHIIVILTLNMTKWSEDMMEEAIEAVKNGLSITKAAKEFDVPYSTLQGRIKGAVPKKEDAADRQLLTESQESWLANWILIQEQLGKAPTHHQIREVVSAMLRLAGITQTPGKCWVSNFFKRHPGIGAKQGKRLDLWRIKSVSLIESRLYLRTLIDHFCGTFDQVNALI